MPRRTLLTGAGQDRQPPAHPLQGEGQTAPPHTPSRAEGPFSSAEGPCTSRAEGPFSGAEGPCSSRALAVPGDRAALPRGRALAVPKNREDACPLHKQQECAYR